MTDERVIGVDLGGTGIKLGLYDREGQCHGERAIATPQPSTPDAVIAAIAGAVADLDPSGNARAIGVGMPGPADAAGRVARIAINLSGWVDVPLADRLEALTGRPVAIANDANCAGLGELWRGAGRGCRDAILLTLGTGVGGAIILDGRLFTGRTGAAGELGLISLDPAGPACNSGNAGSLERFCSIGAVQRRFGCDPLELSRRVETGDERALAAWADYGRTLAVGIASLVYVLTPEVVVLGGGLSAAAPYFLPALTEELEQRVLPISREGMHVVVAALGNDAGRVGAAKLAWDHLAE